MPNNEIMNNVAEEQVSENVANAVMDSVKNSNTLGGVLGGVGGTLAVCGIVWVAKKFWQKRKQKKLEDAETAAEAAADIPISEDDYDEDEEI